MASQTSIGSRQKESGNAPAGARPRLIAFWQELRPRALAAGRAATGRAALPWAGLLLVALALYWPLLSVGLLSDDWGIITGGLPLASLHGHWFGGGHGQFYRPLSRIGIWLQAAIFGTGGTAMHLVSLGLFFSTAGLVAASLARLGHRGAGFLAFGLILVHPAMVESVGWIASQTDLFFGFFFALSLYFLIPPLSRFRTGLSLGAAVLAYLAKDTAILMGPSAAMVCAAGAWMARKRGDRLNPWFFAAAAHLGIWAVYMILRKIFLGQIFPSSSPGKLLVVPLHQSVNFLTVLNELFGTLVPWFAPREAMLKYNAPSVWFWLALGGIFVLLLRARRPVAALTFALFIVAAVPAFLTSHPYFYTGLTGSRRYLYHPMLPFAALIGLLLEPCLFRIRSRFSGSAAVGLIVVAVVFGLETAARITDFTRAAAARDKLFVELDKAFSETRNPLLHVANLPNRIGGAYVMENGFVEYLRRAYPGRGKIVSYSDMTWKDVTPGQSMSYDVAYRGENRPFVVPANEFRQAIAELESRRAQVKAAPNRGLEVNPAKGLLPADVLDLSSNAEAKGVGNGELIFSLSRGGSIGFRLNAGIDSLNYAAGRLQFRFPEAPLAATRNQKLTLEWKPRSLGGSYVTKVMEVPYSSNLQTVSLDLGQLPGFAGFRAMEHFRLSFPASFSGDVAISEVSFTPSGGGVPQ